MSDLFPAELEATTRGLYPGAVLSNDRRRRYSLTRYIGPGAKIALFWMVNPSYADESRNDNTVAKCTEFARLWGCGWLSVVNLFSWISTDPMGLYLAADPVGPENAEHCLRAARAAHESGGPVVCAWGSHGAYRDQDLAAIRWLKRERIPAACLGTTCEGHPRHPGRIAYTTTLEPFKGRSGGGQQWRA